MDTKLVTYLVRKVYDLSVVLLKLLIKLTYLAIQFTHLLGKYSYVGVPLFHTYYTIHLPTHP